MQNQIQDKLDAAFKVLNERLVLEDQQWATKKLEDARAFVEAAREKNHPRHQIAGRFYQQWALDEHFGSKGMADLLMNRSRKDALLRMLKNTMAGIAKRDANIITALNKYLINELPDFELVENSDGYEGWFLVGDYRVHIKTILAGGYNIQRLHHRTLVKVT